jgi:hypothetical protein
MPKRGEREETVRTQQRVELRFATTDHNFGTVSKIWPDGRFRVSFDSYRDEKNRKVSGGRFIYPAHMAANFAWGR